MSDEPLPDVKPNALTHDEAITAAVTWDAYIARQRGSPQPKAKRK